MMSTDTSMTSVADQLISLSNGVDNVPRQYFYDFTDHGDESGNDDNTKILHFGSKGNGLPSPCSQEIIDIDDRGKSESHRLDLYFTSLLKKHKLSHMNPNTYTELGKLSYVTHRSEGSIIDQSNDEKPKEQKEVRKCNLCNITFGSQKSFRSHVSYSHSKKPRVHPRNSIHKVTPRRFPSPSKIVVNSDENISSSVDNRLSKRPGNKSDFNVDRKLILVKNTAELENNPCQETIKDDYDTSDNGGSDSSFEEQCESDSEVSGEVAGSESSLWSRLSPQAGIIYSNDPVSIKTIEICDSLDNPPEDTQCARTLSFKQQMEQHRSHSFKTQSQKGIYRPPMHVQIARNSQIVSSCNHVSSNNYEQRKICEVSKELERVGGFSEKDLLTESPPLINSTFNDFYDRPVIRLDENTCHDLSNINLGSSAVVSMKDIHSVLFQYRDFSNTFTSKLCDLPHSMSTKNEYSCARTKSISEHRLDVLKEGKESCNTRSRLQFWIEKASELIDEGPSVYELMHHRGKEVTFEDHEKLTFTNFNSVSDEEVYIKNTSGNVRHGKESCSHFDIFDKDSPCHDVLVDNVLPYHDVLDDIPTLSDQTGNFTWRSLNDTKIERDSFLPPGNTGRGVVELTAGEASKYSSRHTRINDLGGLCGIKSIVSASEQFITSFIHMLPIEGDDVNDCPANTDHSARLVFKDKPGLLDKGWILLDDNISQYIKYPVNDDLDD